MGAEVNFRYHFLGAIHLFPPHKFSWSEVGLLGQADCPVRSSYLPTCFQFPALELYVQVTRPSFLWCLGIELGSSCTLSTERSPRPSSRVPLMWPTPFFCSIIHVVNSFYFIFFYYFWFSELWGSLIVFYTQSERQMGPLKRKGLPLHHMPASFTLIC